MLGISFIKAGPTDYIIQYKGGRARRQGVGLAFFYFSPTTSLVLVPVGSVDVPFIFKEVTADFQEVTVQGQITFRVSDPLRLSAMMNYSLLPGGRRYASEDPQKLPQRLVNHAQVLTRSSLKSLPLREALGQTDELEAHLRGGMQKAEMLSTLGVEVLGLSILAIKPTSETARALEAEAREQILRQADEAVYARRNSAVEQERAIKENELNTEIAIEVKKRQIRETQMEAQMAVQAKQRELGEAEKDAEIALEQKNQELVSLVTANARAEADSRAYALTAMMNALASTDPRTIQALSSMDMDASRLVALAFHNLAEGADRIGQLNVTPDLLREIVRQSPDRK